FKAYLQSGDRAAHLIVSFHLFSFFLAAFFWQPAIVRQESICPRCGASVHPLAWRLRNACLVRAMTTENDYQATVASQARAPLIEIRDLDKTFRLGEIEIKALRNVNLTIGRGEFVAIMGASGSGKSTLMNILGCLDRPTAGAYLLE